MRIFNLTIEVMIMRQIQAKSVKFFFVTKSKSDLQKLHKALNGELGGCVLRDYNYDSKEHSMHINFSKAREVNIEWQNWMNGEAINEIIQEQNVQVAYKGCEYSETCVRGNDFLKTYNKNVDVYS